MKIFIKILFLLFFFQTTQGFGQEKSIVITKDFEGLTFDEFVKKVESKYPLHFYFEKESIPNFTVKLLSCPNEFPYTGSVIKFKFCYCFLEYCSVKFCSH